MSAATAALLSARGSPRLTLVGPPEVIADYLRSITDVGVNHHMLAIAQSEQWSNYSDAFALVQSEVVPHLRDSASQATPARDRIPCHVLVGNASYPCNMGVTGETMKRSTNRILTTHTGSLPRPNDLVALVEGHDQQELAQDAHFEQRVKEAVRDIVHQQIDAHVDIVNDGEASKVGYATYITERLTGFEGGNRAARPQVEAATFPDFYQQRVVGAAGLQRPVCSGPITWRGDAQVRRDVDNLKTALEGTAV